MNINTTFLLCFTLLCSCKTTKPLYSSLSVNPLNIIKSQQDIHINSMGVWHAFEGELGYIELIDPQGERLAMGIMSATGEWMTSGPVMYKTTLIFNPGNATHGTLLVHNNPGGGSGHEAGKALFFEIPVRFKP